MRELTQDDFKLVLEERVKEVRFGPMISGAGLYKAPLMDKSDFGKYIIKINELKDQEEQKLGLIHEILHILCPMSTAEEVIETETKRFYEENREFVNKIYENLKHKK